MLIAVDELVNELIDSTPSFATPPCQCFSGLDVVANVWAGMEDLGSIFFFNKWLENGIVFVKEMCFFS